MLHRFIFLLEQNLSPILGSEAVTETAAAATETAGVVTETAADGGLFSSPFIWVIYGALFVGMYFLLIRPQRRRDKKMKEMQSSIKVGDNVVTTGGLFGRIADVGEDCFIVEFGTNRGIRIPVQKSDVLGIKAPKTTPAPKDALEKKD